MNDDPVDALLADLRTDVPEMSDKAFEAGRARLQATVSSEPVVTVLERDVAVVPLPKRRLLRSPPRKLVMSAAAAAAMVALAAGVLVVQDARFDSAAPVESASVQLNAIADKINLVDEPIGSDQYRYVVTRGWGMYGGSTGTSGDARPNTDLKVMVETVYEEWVPADPTLQCTSRHTTTGNRRWVEGTAELARENGFEDRLPKSEVRELTVPCDRDSDKYWGSPSPELLASMPRDPSQLNDYLRDDPQRTHVVFGPDLTLVSNVVTLLTTGRVPADLRAALYRTLAMTPGLEVTEQVANLDGHKGTAFGVTESGQRREVIIDPTTGQYIGQRSAQVAGYQGPPAVEPVPGAADRTIPAPTTKEDLVVSYFVTARPVIVDRVGETS